MKPRKVIAQSNLYQKNFQSKYVPLILFPIPLCSYGDLFGHVIFLQLLTDQEDVPLEPCLSIKKSLILKYDNRAFFIVQQRLTKN